MSHTGPTERAVRTIRLDDESMTALLDRLDSAAQQSTPQDQGSPERYRHRVNGTIIHMQQPGSMTTAAYLVPTRYLSQRELSFLHGGFVHRGTRCWVQLITLHGTWNDIDATVLSCHHVEGNIHEVVLRFDDSLDPGVYCAAAVQSRVLLAEDDPSITRLATFHLGQLNATVDHAPNGRVAIDKAINNTYEVILMDMDMPEVDGFAATRELRRRGYSGTIVAATALTQPADRQRCLDAGCDDYLPKPFNRKTLSDLLTFVREEPLVSSFFDDPSMSDMIDSFVKELPARIRPLEEAIVQGDKDRLVALTRALKAEGSGYGFEAITEAASKIEAALMSGVGLSDVQNDLRALIRLCLRVRSSTKQAQSRAEK